MASSCNGRQFCSISEQAFKLNQVDSCPGTERYLEAHYKCTPDKGPPPWLVPIDPNQSRRKVGRVPITVKPTTSTTTTTTSTTTTTTTTTRTTAIPYKRKSILYNTEK